MSDNYDVARAFEALRLRLVEHETFARDVAELLGHFERCEMHDFCAGWRRIAERSTKLGYPPPTAPVVLGDMQQGSES